MTYSKQFSKLIKGRGQRNVGSWLPLRLCEMVYNDNILLTYSRNVTLTFVIKTNNNGRSSIDFSHVM